MGKHFRNINPVHDNFAHLALVSKDFLAFQKTAKKHQLEYHLLDTNSHRFVTIAVQGNHSIVDQLRQYNPREMLRDYGKLR